jgi:hypothetical protein
MITDFKKRETEKYGETRESVSRQLQHPGDLVQALVASPDQGRIRQCGGSQQVGIDIPDPLSHQFIALDKVQCLFLRGYRCLGQIVEQTEHITPLVQIPAGQFTNHKGVRKYLTAIRSQPHSRRCLILPAV